MAHERVPVRQGIQAIRAQAIKVSLYFFLERRGQVVRTAEMNLSYT